MSDDLKNLQSQLALITSAIDKVIDKPNVPNSQNMELTTTDFVNEAESLLQRCDAVCKEYDVKPTIRIIHHFACSGGSLISKCISALPNVYLLSEVHPYSDLHFYSDRPVYRPSDIISLSKYARIPEIAELSSKIFKESVTSVFRHVEELGGC